MPGHIPQLDEQTLARLRQHVLSLRRQTDGQLPLHELVDLATGVSLDVGVTLDLAASEQLGAPLVVVRIPAATSASDTKVLDGLTRREIEVCALVASGRTNKEIAARLYLSLATVKDHVHNILQKTGLPNRASLAASFHKNTLADGEPSTGSS